MRVDLVAAARVGHSHVKHGLEVGPLPQVLRKQSKALGPGCEVVLERGQVMLLGVFYSFSILFLGKPSPFTIDCDLRSRERCK